MFNLKGRYSIIILLLFALGKAVVAEKIIDARGIESLKMIR